MRYSFPEAWKVPLAPNGLTSSPIKEDQEMGDMPFQLALPPTRLFACKFWQTLGLIAPHLPHRVPQGLTGMTIHRRPRLHG